MSTAGLSVEELFNQNEFLVYVYRRVSLCAVGGTSECP